MKKHKNSNKGFTLVELIVTVALMSILSVLVISSYTKVMREQRHDADQATLNDLNYQLSILFTDIAIWNEIVDELEPNKTNKNDTLQLTFVCTPTGKKGTFKLANTKIGNSASGPALSGEMPLLYQGLIDTFGDSITMESSDHQQGTYVVTCKFNSEQLSSVREFTLTNDNTRITGKEDWRKADS
jgi:prepilin-type N-terminal cleavage/methylation domain-containing protein